MRGLLFFGAAALALAQAPAQAGISSSCGGHDSLSVNSLGVSSMSAACEAASFGHSDAKRISGVVMQRFADARVTKQKARRAPEPPLLFGYYEPKAGEPARMVQLPTGQWVSSYGCYMDEGNNRYRSCNDRR